MTTHEQSGRDAQTGSAEKQHKDELLDEALAESFPASDPTSTLIADEPVKDENAQRQRSDSDKGDSDKSESAARK